MTNNATVSAHELAGRLADAVRQVPGVHTLNGGPVGAVATYGRGPRIEGVKVSNDLLVVQIVAELDRPLGQTEAAVRRAVADISTKPLQLHIVDVVGQLP